MIEIYTIKKTSSSADDFENNPDNEFMKQSAEVDKTPPASWNKYDQKTLEGINKIIEMEYKELSTFKSIPEYRKNLIHLAVALLRAWRITKDVK